MTWKAYALVSSAGMIATYFVSVPSRPVEPPAPRIKAAQVQATTDIQELSLRLGAKVRAAAAFGAPARNPFRFGVRQPVRRQVAAAPAAVLQPAALISVVAPVPPVSLLGIAADDVDGMVQRTAIVKTSQGVLLVRTGDAVGADYKVSKVEDEAVELTSTADGAVRRISFKP
jgi:hypothetical protein